MTKAVKLSFLFCFFQCSFEIKFNQQKSVNRDALALEEVILMNC